MNAEMVIVTPCGVVTPKRWGRKILSEVRFGKNQWPDKRTKKGRLAAKYLKKVIDLEVRKYIRGIV